jgi:hypothetical protein
MAPPHTTPPAIRCDLPVSPQSPAPEAGPARNDAERPGGRSLAPDTATMPVAVTHARAPDSGSERLVIRLDPASLGPISVDIRTASDGQRDIRIAVEKPETLNLLRQDRHHLEAALNRAGIATEPARIQLDLAAPGSFQDRAEQPTRAVAAPHAALADFTGGSADGGGGTFQPRRPQPEPRLHQPALWAEDHAAALPPRAGLDITA